MYCNADDLACSILAKHTPAVAVVHSDDNQIRDLTSVLESLTEKWHLSEKRLRPSTIQDLCTAEEVKNGFVEAKIRHDTLQPQLLVLEDDEDANEGAFQFLCAKGQPFVIECQDSIDSAFWYPDSLAEQFGNLGGTIKNAVTGEKTEVTSIKEFFEGLKYDREDIWKIADFPETDCKMENTIPDILAQAHKAMPFKRHILPNGALNLVSAIHWRMNMPDIKAKFFCGDGSLNEKAATRIHTDLANAANICLWSKPCSEDDIPKKVEFLKPLLENINDENVRNNNYAALWYVFLSDDYTKVSDFLRNKYPDMDDEQDHKDPIQKRAYLLTIADLADLERQHSVRPIVFLQRVGDVVVLPANLPHQVLNINACVKMAFDFVSHTTCSRAVEHLFERVKPAKGREDYIGLPRVIFHAMARAARTLQSADLQRTKIEEKEREIEQLRERLRLLESGGNQPETPAVKPKRKVVTSKRSVGRPPKRGKRKRCEESQPAQELVFTTASAMPGRSHDVEDYKEPTLTAVPSTSQVDRRISVDSASDSFTNYKPVRRRHMKKEVNQTTKCQLCSVEVSSAKEMRAHISEQHEGAGGEGQLCSCWFCPKIFLQGHLEERLMHMKEKHPSRFCQSCGKW